MIKPILPLLLLSAASAFSGVISSPTTGITPAGFGTPGVTASVSNLVLATNAIASATACFSPYCPGGDTPGAGPDYVVLDPIVFRLTEAVISCQSRDGCSKLFLRAAFSFLATSSSQYSIQIGVDGNSLGAVSGMVTGFAANGVSHVIGNRTFSYVPAPVVVNPPPTVDPGGNYTSPGGTGAGAIRGGNIQDSFTLGTLDVTAGQTVNGYLMLSIASLNGTVSFPDSITMTLVDVPEPATITLLFSALAVLALGRRRR